MSTKDLIKSLTKKTCGESSCDECNELREAAAIKLQELEWHPISESWPMDMLAIDLYDKEEPQSIDVWFFVDKTDADKKAMQILAKGLYSHWRIHRRPE